MAGLERVNPVQLLDELPGKIKKAREGESLSAEQVRAVIAAAADSFWLEARVRLGLDTGLRLWEQAALCWSDFDLDARRVNVCKGIKHNPCGPTIGSTKTDGKGDRRPEFTSETAGCLRDHRKQQGADREMLVGYWPDAPPSVDFDSKPCKLDLRGRVFLTGHGTPLDPPNLRTRLATLARWAGGVDRLSP